MTNGGQVIPPTARRLAHREADRMTEVWRRWYIRLSEDQKAGDQRIRETNKMPACGRQGFVPTRYKEVK